MKVSHLSKNSSSRRTALLVACLMPLGWLAAAQSAVPQDSPSKARFIHSPDTGSRTNRLLPKDSKVGYSGPRTDSASQGKFSSRLGSSRSTPTIAEIEALVRQLALERSELKAAVEAIKVPQPEPADSHGRKASVLTEITKELGESDSQQRTRVRQLRLQIYRLQEILERPPTCAGPVLPPVPDPEMEPPDEYELPAPIEPKDRPPVVPPVEPQAFPPIQKQSASPAAEAIPIPVVDEPVDRLRLADNLFATGEFELAMEIYGRISKGDLEQEQKTWIEYQMAGCQRELGNKPEAEKLYRLVTGTQDAGFLGEAARWWLESLRSRHDATQAHAQFNTAIQTIGKQFDESEKP